MPTESDVPYPLVQKRQADALEACGFLCAPVGEREFGGQMVEMWQPTGERRQAVAGLIGYGGAAYGGKSYLMLILGRMAAECWPGVQITYFRRTYTELDGPGASIQKSYELFGDVAQDREGGKEWVWPNGSALYFRHAQNEKDVYRYQSQQIDVLLIDEATSFSWQMVDYLLTRNRVSGDIAGFRPFALLATNPGNVGHAWYAQVFDIPMTPDEQAQHERVKRVQNPNGKFSRVYFIPAFLEDNQIGVARDPDYETRLMERDPEVARALRYGDWGVFAGQMFPLWLRDRIVCEPFDIPDWWPRWRAVDYGLTHDWAAGWFAMDPDTKRIYVYRAVLRAGLTDRQQARLIAQMTPPDEHIIATYGGHDYWAKSGKGLEQVTTSADEYMREGVPLTKADTDRVNGVRKLHRLLVDMPDGMPGIQVFAPYYDVFACMASLIRDPRNPEDVQKVAGDDAYDMLRYGLTNLEPRAITSKRAKRTIRRVQSRHLRRWSN